MNIDILGWFAPAIVTIKLLLQKLWQLQLDWDHLVPNDIAQDWRTWREELPLLTDHAIPRCYYSRSKKRLSTQLHGFCDASQLAYAGVVYLQTVYTDTTTTISLVTSKTKVAPLKTLTIPRLELCGAQLLSKLLLSTKDALAIPIQDVHTWCDSTISLGWLNTSPQKLKTFVSNRVTDTVKRVPFAHWHYVNMVPTLPPSNLQLWEIEAAERRLLSLSQQQFFNDRLKSSQELSNILMLRPLLDDYGLLRVGGRLQRADVDNTLKHPLILHRKANIANLLNRHLHQTAPHAGPSTHLGLLASTHHVIGAKHLVRRMCVVCQKVYAKTVNQVMGPLQLSRLTPAPPLTHTGADFAGPLTLKRRNPRKPSFIKAYICQFICMSTKAVHLELVTDLSTEAFFACFRRSISRRGCPKTLRTDNGTNFVGAWRELHVIYHLLQS